MVRALYGNLCLAQRLQWIPAYAGMTILGRCARNVCAKSVREMWRVGEQVTHPTSFGFSPARVWRGGWVCGGEGGLFAQGRGVRKLRVGEQAAALRAFTRRGAA